MQGMIAFATDWGLWIVGGLTLLAFSQAERLGLSPRVQIALGAVVFLGGSVWLAQTLRVALRTGKIQKGQSTYYREDRLAFHTVFAVYCSAVLVMGLVGATTLVMAITDTIPPAMLDDLS